MWESEALEWFLVFKYYWRRGVRTGQQKCDQSQKVLLGVNLYWKQRIIKCALGGHNVDWVHEKVENGLLK